MQLRNKNINVTNHMYMSRYVFHRLGMLGVLILLTYISIQAQSPRAVPTAYGGSMPINTVSIWESNSPQTDINAMMTKPLREVKQSRQYFDGLGRLIQKVDKQGSLITDPGNPNSGAGAKDFISMIEYDLYGREIFKYLPTPSTATDGTQNNGLFKLNPFQQQATFYGNTDGNINPIAGQGETFFYGETRYEASPLSRVMEVAVPGNSWTGSMYQTTETSRRSAKTKYYTNTEADDVRMWTVNIATLPAFSSYSSTSEYLPGTLHKNVTIDEHDKQVIEYKDREGKLLLKKVQLTAAKDEGAGSGHSGWLCTYYVYDDLDNLRCVIQPRGVELISSAWILTDNIILAEQCFRYEYDHRNRMVIKKVPGASEVYMVYDTRDRLVMMQDSSLRVQSKWMVNLYDDLNRPVQTGLLLNTWNNKTFEQHRVAASPNPAPLGFSPYPFSASGTPGATYWEYLTKMGYDNYSDVPAGSGFGTTSSIDQTYAGSTYGFNTTYNTSPDFAQAFPTSGSTLARGLVTWTETKVLGTSSYIYSVNYYDEKGRVVQTRSKNLTGGTDILNTQYNWAGQPLVTVFKQEKAGAPAQTTVVITRYSYDDLGRPVQTEKKIQNTNVNSNQLPSAYTTVSKNEYDALGQLKRKTIGNKKDPATNNYYNPRQPLQELTYDYNIRGWMLGMNRGYLSTEGQTSDGKLFGFELGYDKLTNTAGRAFTGSGEFSGNIGGMIWKSDGDDIRRKYDFRYDAANRLLRANFEQHNGDDHTWNNSQINYAILMGDGNTGTSAYDANGNIKSMTQYGFKAGGNSQTPIDQLTYNYMNDGKSNKLLNVIDGQNDATTKLGDFRTSTLHPTQSKTATTIDYTYDANGNLLKDLNKDIGDASNNGITYNYLNLPETITIRTAGGLIKGKITYTYDATGNKLKKETVENASASNGNITTTTTTSYLDGFLYESKTDNNAQTTDYTDQLQSIAHEEGRVRFVPAVGSMASNLQYDYFIKDHLGNIRMVLTEEQNPNYYPATTLEGIWDGSTNSMVNYERNFYNIDQSKITSESSIPSWGTETIANTKLYYNHNDVPPSSPNPSYPAGVNPTQTAGSNKLYKLNATSNKTGLEFVMKVMAGDKIDIFGKSYYLNTTTVSNSNSTAMDLLGMFGSLLLSPANAVGAKGITATQLQNWNLGLVPGTFFRGNNNETGTTVPKAYINFIFLDEQFKFVNGGASRVGSSGSVKNHWTEDPVLQDISVQKNGYLFVYVSNESNFDVFFDNLQVVHKPGPLVEETHYYPFGLAMAGISSKALKPNYRENKRKFNEGTELQSGEFSDGSGLELYATNFRSLDPQIGRFWQIDPLAEAHPNLTSYAYVNNNPLRYNDPWGLDTVRVNGEGSHKIKVRQGDVLAWTIGETTSYYTYDPGNEDAVNGFVGGGIDGGTMEEVTVTAKGKKSSSAPLPLWFDPAVSGAEYRVGKVLDRYGSDGYGKGRPFWPGPAQRVFDRNFPKGSYANTRPVNLHLPVVGRSVEAPRYIVSATGQVLKFVGVASAAINGISTEIKYANGEISNAHRWTNHAMTVVGFMGPGGVAVSLIYSAVVEDMIFKGNAPGIWKSSWIEAGLIPPAF